MVGRSIRALRARLAPGADSGRLTILTAIIGLVVGGAILVSGWNLITSVVIPWASTMPSSFPGGTPAGGGTTLAPDPTTTPSTPPPTASATASPTDAATTDPTDGLVTEPGGGFVYSIGDIPLSGGRESLAFHFVSTDASGRALTLAELPNLPFLAAHTDGTDFDVSLGDAHLVLPDGTRIALDGTVIAHGQVANGVVRLLTVTGGSIATDALPAHWSDWNTGHLRFSVGGSMQSMAMGIL